MIKIYKIISSNTDSVYVGSTKQRWLCDRFSTHNVQYRRYCKGIDKLWVSSFDILKYEDCKIELIEETEEPNKEAYWIKELNAINIKKLDKGKNGCPIKKKIYIETHKEERRLYLKEYRAKNKEILNIKQNIKKQCPHCEKMISSTNLKRHITTQHSPTNSPF